MLKPIVLSSPDDSEFPELSFQIDDRHAVSTDGLYVRLIGIIPDPQAAGAYRVTGHATVGIDEERTVAGLERIIERLKSISGYELLTKHYNADATTFFVNRDSSFTLTYEAGEAAAPVDQQNPLTGRDY